MKSLHLTLLGIVTSLVSSAAMADTYYMDPYRVSFSADQTGQDVTILHDGHAIAKIGAFVNVPAYVDMIRNDAVAYGQGDANSRSLVDFWNNLRQSAIENGQLLGINLDSGVADSDQGVFDVVTVGSYKIDYLSNLELSRARVLAYEHSHVYRVGVDALYSSGLGWRSFDYVDGGIHFIVYPYSSIYLNESSQTVYYNPWHGLWWEEIHGRHLYQNHYYHPVFWPYSGYESVTYWNWSGDDQLIVPVGFIGYREYDTDRYWYGRPEWHYNWSFSVGLGSGWEFYYSGRRYGWDDYYSNCYHPYVAPSITVYYNGWNDYRSRNRIRFEDENYCTDVYRNHWDRNERDFHFSNESRFYHSNEYNRNGGVENGRRQEEFRRDRPEWDRQPNAGYNGRGGVARTPANPFTPINGRDGSNPYAPGGRTATPAPVDGGRVPSNPYNPVSGGRGRNGDNNTRPINPSNPPSNGGTYVPPGGRTANPPVDGGRIPANPYNPGNGRGGSGDGRTTPPSNPYNPPSNGGGRYTPPSNPYNPPSNGGGNGGGRFNPPSNPYNPPSNGGGNGGGRFNPPSNPYNPPSNGGGNGGGRFNPPSNPYNPPSNGGGNGGGRYTPPSNPYNPPSNGGGNGGGRFNPPSNPYNPPSNGGGNGGGRFNPPSNPYNPPSNGGGNGGGRFNPPSNGGGRTASPFNPPSNGGGAGSRRGR